MFAATYRNYSRVKSPDRGNRVGRDLILRTPLRDVLHITNTCGENNLRAAVYRTDYERIFIPLFSPLSSPLSSFSHIYVHSLALFRATTFRARNKDLLKGSRGNEGSVPRCLHFAVSLGDKGRRNRRCFDDGAISPAIRPILAEGP